MGKAKKGGFYFLSAVLSLFFIFNFAACDAGVVPSAWVALKSDDGYVYYTSNMYGNTGAHIYLYEDETATNKLLEISFAPRILGPDYTATHGTGETATTVDISGTYSMFIQVYKNTENSVYSAEKDVYLNDEKLTPDLTTDYENYVLLEYYNFRLVRGNPDGKENDVINYIEYK